METEILFQIDKTFNDLLEILSSSDEITLNKIPCSGSWTMAQVGEHLLKSYSVADTLKGPVEKTERDPEEKVGRIKEVFLNFDVKFKSPEFILPSDGLIIKDELLNSLTKRCDQIKHIAQEMDLTETCTGFDLPGLGRFTRLEWINFFLAHTQRHIHQLKNISQTLN